MRLIVGTVSSIDDDKVKIALPDKNKTVTKGLQVVYPIGNENEELPKVDDIVMAIYLDNGTGYVLGQIKNK